MANTLRAVSKGIFVSITVVAVILFFLACSSAFLEPERYWFISILGVGMIFWVVLLLLLFFFWLLFRSRWAILPLIALAIGYKQVNALFAFHMPGAFRIEKVPGSFRILQYNVARFNAKDKKSKKNQISMRTDFFKLIRNYNVDIFCAEEFFESNDTSRYDKNIPVITKELGFPYYYYAKDHQYSDGTYETGVAIFSKYPIVGQGRFRYGGPDSLKGNESLIYADIKIDGQVIRVFATHLQSMMFNNADFKSIRKIRSSTDSALENTKGIFKKFKRVYPLRMNQVKLVKEEMDQSPYPELICGDFNDVPTSWSHFTILENRQDAFTKKGFGLGRTFTGISPTLRIDYIITNKRFEVLQCNRIKVFYSDHFPVMADLRLR
jgi:endonuclease/exonuclease/phosphatase family metal-dependent hydrolase